VPLICPKNTEFAFYDYSQDDGFTISQSGHQESGEDILRGSGKTLSVTATTITIVRSKVPAIFNL